MRYITYPICLLLLFSFLGCKKAQQKSPGDIRSESELLIENRDLASDRVERITSNCGEMEVDPMTGEVTRTPNVDLVVKHLEIFTTSRGTWIRPTIKNLCTGSIEENIHVYIKSDHDDDIGVIVTYAGLLPQTDTPLGYAVGVPNADSYTVIVDYDLRIPEADNNNNRCTRSETGNCS